MWSNIGFVNVNLGKKLYRRLIMPIPLFAMDIFFSDD